MMLDARPQLTWRDVMDILARTAERTDSANSSWFENGAGLFFSPDYGFGKVNAELAVQEAQSWRLLPQEQQPIADQQTINEIIPDGVISGVTRTFQISQTLGLCTLLSTSKRIWLLITTLLAICA